MFQEACLTVSSQDSELSARGGKWKNIIWVLKAIKVNDTFMYEGKKKKPSFFKHFPFTMQQLYVLALSSHFLLMSFTNHATNSYTNYTVPLFFR